jgi:hypothetical protein
VELGALRNPQVTTVPSNEANAFYQSAPYAEREINKYLYEEYRKIREAKDKFARGDLSKYRFEEAIRKAKYNINQMKPSVENGLDQAGLDYLDQKQQEGISSLKDTVSTEFNPDFSMPELDQSRDQIVLGEKMNESVLAHEIGHAAFSVAKDFFRSKVVELGSIEDALKATALEYGRNIADKIEAGVRGNLDGLFADTDEATVQYYDNPLGDDPSNPGVGTPTSEGGPTYYSPGGGFDADTDNTFSFLPSDRANTTDPLLQKPFTDYRTGELVYHDEYKGDFEADLKEAGLMGFETLMSDLISERKGLDRFAERQRRGLKINPLGAPKGEVLRSVKPQTRPEKFAQGGPVMRGIGTLNETARNMFRGPSGVAAYQQFADGGPVYMSNGGEGSVGAAYKDTINKYAEEFLVNPDVLFNLLKTESNFNPKAVNKASGAQGIAQVMPDTAADPGYDVTPLSNPFNAEDSIRFSAEYLSAMLEEFRGDYDLALAAYNAGPGRVRTYRGVPPFAETQNYIEKILGRVAPDEKQGRSGSGVNEQGEQVFTPRPLLRGETGYKEELEGMPLKPRMRPSSLSQGIMAAQDTVDPAVIDRVVEQVQEELPPTQEEGDLYEKYSPENMFPDAGLTEGELERRKRFAPKEGDAEPYRQPPSTLEQIDQFFQRFAPSRKPERVIQPKPTPMQYRSA